MISPLTSATAAARLCAAAFFLLLLGAGCAKTVSAPDARRSLETGWQQYGGGAFDAAEETFAHIARRAPQKSAEHAQALYGMATVCNLRRPGDDPRRAGELYRQVIALDPHGELAAWSELALARMRALVPVDEVADTAAVQAAYQEVFDAHPDQLAGAEAFLLLQTTRVQSYREAETRTALAALEKFAASHADSLYLSAAHLLMAACRRTLHEPDGQLTELIKALEIREARARRKWEKNPVGDFRFDDPSAASEIFRIAHVAEYEAGDFETARNYYRRFLRDNPTDRRCFPTTQALARMDRAEARLRESSPPPPAPPRS